MPEQINGKPVDEEKWQKAKKLAAEQGHAEEYDYTMGIYKQMANIKSQVYEGVSEPIYFNEVDVKGDRKYVVKGYISTGDIDTFNDQVTEQCMEDMLQQIKANSIKIDEEHETYHKKDYDITPKLRITDAGIDKKGLWVEALVNKAHKDFKETWNSIKSGFLDAFSIQFKPLEKMTTYVKGKAINVLNKVKLINVGITGTPVNDHCKITNVMVKALNEIEAEYQDLDAMNESELKAKYIKRTGRPGNYKYFYKESDGKKGGKGSDKMKDSTADDLRDIADKMDNPDLKRTEQEEEIIKEAKKEKITADDLRYDADEMDKKPNKESKEKVGKGEKEEKEVEKKSHSSEPSSDINKMAEEEKVETAAESKPEAEESKEKSEESKEEGNEVKAEVKAVQKENAELKARLNEIEKKLAEPQMKATQESPQPIKQKATSPLGLIR